MSNIWATVGAIAAITLTAAPVVNMGGANIVSRQSGSFCWIDAGSDTGPTCTSSAIELAELRNEAGKAAMSSVRIARLFDNRDYDASAGFLDIYAASDCTMSTGNIDYQIADLGVWKDRISSFQSTGNCGARLFSAVSFAGSSYPATGYLTFSAFVGSAFNDRARSAQFS